MTWQRKTWMVVSMATVLAFVSTVSLAATNAPLPDAPTPASIEDPVGSGSAGIGSARQQTSVAQYAPGDPVAGGVTVSVRIEPARLLVLNDEGRVMEIWSNTGEADVDPLLIARLHSVAGPALPEIPERALSEYRLLVGQVNWSARGLVYTAD